MMLDTTPPRDFYESKSDDEEADIFQQIDEWISALEEVSDDDLRSWIEVLEERARDGPRDNEEVGWLKAMKDEMTGRNPYGSSPGFRVLIDPDTYPDTWWTEKSLEQKKAVVLAQGGFMVHRVGMPTAANGTSHFLSAFLRACQNLLDENSKDMPEGFYIEMSKLFKNGYDCRPEL